MRTAQRGVSLRVLRCVFCPDRVWHASLDLDAGGRLRCAFGAHQGWVCCAPYSSRLSLDHVRRRYI